MFPVWFPLIAVTVGCSGGSFEEVPQGQPETSVDATDDTSVDTNIPETCATPNACGGCATLAHAVGDTCGVCKTGTWKCDGLNAMVCNDPFTGPLPDTACGTCGTQKLACGPDGMSAVCPRDDANACGGCGAIANFPGTACGKCGTLQYKCTTDKSGTVCPGDDANACGGCTTLTNPKGAVCGVCMGGSYVCNGLEATRCSDPVTTPPPGTVCGICSKSTYACASGGTTTTCTLPDERTAGFDTLYSTFDTSIWTLSGVDTPGATHAIGFTMPRIGTITSVTIGLVKYDADATSLHGSVAIQLIKGNPTATPAPADILVTTSISGDTLPVSPATTTVPLVGAPRLNAGDRVWIKITDSSARYNYGLLGGPATGPSHLSNWYTTTGGYAEYTSYDPYLKVGMTGCY